MGLPTRVVLGYRKRVARVGDRIGEYRIVGERTRAATFSTFEAVHVVLPRRALIKIMSSTVQRVAVRALREAYFLETFEHVGIPRIFESALLPDRRPWFAREMIEGQNLTSVIGQASTDRIELISLLRDTADVLVHVHKHGLVHTGLRPERILLTAKTRPFSVCIPDWSEARAHDAPGVPYVPLAGSWHYAAPELVSGEAIDDRADVFSLGVIGYQLLTNTLPFDRGAIAMREAAGHHVPTEVRCPDAPRELTAMIDQMLSFDRWDRPTSGEVRADLTWLLESLASSMLRIRKPRWTPEVTFASVSAVDDYDQLAVEPPTDDDSHHQD